MDGRVLRCLVALWAVEVALARVTGVPLAWMDLIGVLGVYGVLGVGLAVWRPRGRIGRAVWSVLGVGPLALVVAGIVGPPARDGEVWAAWVGWLGAIGIAVGWGWIESRMANHEWRITNHESRIANRESRRSPAARSNPESRLSNGDSRIANGDSRIANPDSSGADATIGGGDDYVVLARRDSSAAGFEIRDSRFERSGIRDSGFGIRDSGFGIRDSGFAIRDSRFELRGPRFPKNHRFPSSPLATTTAVTATALLAWLIDGAHDPISLLPFLAFALLTALLTTTPTTTAVLIVATLLLARIPSSPPPITLSPGTAEGPDVVLISVDTLRADAPFSSADRIGPKAPIQAASPWTLPSMTSLMTGLPVSEHRAGRLADGGYGGMHSNHLTLAERLRERGYATIAVVAPNPFVGREFGFARGFDHFDHLRDETEAGLPRGKYRGSPGRPFLARAATAAGLWPQPVWGGGETVVGRAVAALDDAGERPVFLWVHLLDPHLPYGNAMSLDRPWRERAWLTAATRREVLSDSGVDRALLAEGYANEVARTDAAIHHLLDSLGPPPARGRIVALVSDHGEAFWEHGDFEHGHAFWQEVVAVPFALSEPHTIGGQVEIADALLTLAEGRPLTGDGAHTDDRPPMEPVYVSENLMHGGAPFAAWSALEGTTKAIFHADGPAELYDLGVDPGEQSNLAPAGVPDSLREAPHGWPDAAAPLDLAPDATDQLKALGYVE